MSESQRVRLTKRLLKEALISLLRKKRIEKVTIKEICKTAEINRTTFYKYYQDEYALLKEIEDIAIFKLNENIDNDISPYETIKGLLTYISENVITFKVLFSNNVDLNFAQKIFNIPKIYDQIEKNLKNQYNTNEIKKFTCFITNGGYSLVKEWIYNDNPESVEDMSKIIIKIISNSINM